MYTIKHCCSRLFLFCFVIISVSTSQAQDKSSHGCGTDIATKNYFASHAEEQKNFELTQTHLQKNYLQNQNRISKVTAAQYTIPVVFHILHTGGPENVSDAVITSALTQINSDFSASGSDFSSIFTPFQALYTDAGIKFMLARKDPNGQCTNGIIHYYNTNTVWQQSNMSLYNSISWPTTQYLNIIIVKQIVPPGGGTGIISGYTYPPGTFGTGSLSDAIVYNYTFLNGLQARSLTHEIGHWLNLQHTFGTSNNPGVICGDDGVTDTPPTKGTVGTCPVSSNNPAYTCASPNPTNTADYFHNIENFMDLSSCPKNFTNGQASRMQLALQSSVSGRNQLSSSSNLIFTDVANASPCPPPVAQFSSTTNNYTLCAGQSLVFTDYSTGGPATTWQWTGNNGVVFSSPTASTTSATFPNTGVSNVTLTASNAFGSGSMSRQITITTCSPVAQFSSTTNNYTVCTGNSLQFSDKSTGGISTWQWSGGNGVVFSAPTASTTTATFPNTGVSNVTLTVSNAFGSSSSSRQITITPCSPVAQFSSTTNNYTVCSGQSLVFSDHSTGGAATTWQWSGSNGVVFSSPSASTTTATFPNTGVSNVTLTVSNAVGSGSTSRQITINSCGPVAQFSSTPNISTLCAGNSLLFSDQSTGSPTNWQWAGDNGVIFSSPNASTTSANFPNTGVSNVTLTVSNAGGSGSVSKQITINPCIPVAQFSSTTNSYTVCSNNSLLFSDYSSGGVSTWQWGGDNGVIFSSPNTSITSANFPNTGVSNVSLTVTNSAGSSSVSKQITVNTCTVSGLAENETSYFNIYPNPVEKEFILEGVQKAKLEVRTILGEKILEMDVVPGKNTINLEGISSGVYFIHVKNGEHNRIKKIIKQ